MQHGTTTKNIFQKYKLIDCKHQPENVGLLLYLSKVPLFVESTIKHIMKVSHYLLCEKLFYCHYIKEGSKFKFISLARGFILKTYFHYETPNLIYRTI